MTDTETKWRDRVTAWRASGQTAEDFAHGREFEPSTLRYWASRLRSKSSTGASSSAPHVQLVRVDRAPQKESTSPIVIAIGAARIEVHAGFDRALLGEVVAALGGAR